MIRTTLSFCLLFGSLLAASKWLHQTNHSRPADAPASSGSHSQPAEGDGSPANTTRAVTVNGRRDRAIRLVSWNDDSLNDVLNALRPERPVRREATDDQAD